MGNNKENLIEQWFKIMNILKESGKTYHCSLGILKPNKIFVKSREIIPKGIYQEFYKIAKDKLEVPHGNVYFWSDEGIVRISAHTPEGKTIYVDLDMEKEKSEIKQILEKCWKILPFNITVPIVTLEELYEERLI